tara:strand:+ start:5796 stop:6050 length:255 start_codon:yes stop_codon:yes gene_type:complete
MANTKTPYELRFDIYKTAQQRLMDQYHSDHGLWESFDYWKRDQESQGQTVEHKCPVGENRPSSPTHSEILKEAEKIYDFVQQKG